MTLFFWRWISLDKKGFTAKDPNLTRYVNNSALLHTDPDGNIPRWMLDPLINTIPGGQQGVQGIEEAIQTWQDGAQVWQNSQGDPLPLRVYETVGIMGADATGIRCISDAFYTNDAVDGHVQGWAERIIDGVSGTGRLATVAGLGVAALRGGGTFTTVRGTPTNGGATTGQIILAEAVENGGGSVGSNVVAPRPQLPTRPPHVRLCRKTALLMQGRFRAHYAPRV